ncbi:MAG: glyoxalase/bleomycin resistance protein/dioxygenase [Dactylosporangium sp.]|nr:glyoxalase/bleomycin resistance protein/dioxygenase [Dactylosporangium sp.]
MCGLFTAGLFVLCCGTGMSSVPIAALGVAVGLLGPVVIGLSSIRANRPDVFGTAHVSQSSPPPTTGVTGRADLHLVVNAQGVHNAVVRIRDASVPVGKWPDVGATLPVLIPNGNPRRLQVLWDHVRDHHDLAMDDVSYSPYPEKDYLDESTDYENTGYEDRNYEGRNYEGADYEGYPVDEPLAEQASVTEPVVVEESPERQAEPAPSEEIPVPAAVASPAAVSAAHPSESSTAAPVSEAVATAAPPRRRPSPRPRRQTAPTDSVDAVVPVATAASQVVPPVSQPLETQSGVVEAKPVMEAKLAAIEFVPVEPAPAQPPTADPESPSPLPRRVPGFTRADPAQFAVPTPSPVPDEQAAAADASDAEAAGKEAVQPNLYVASYLADAPEDAKQGLSGVHNVSVTVIVSDLQQSLTFYRDLLGLTEIDGGMGSAILVSGNARILLRQVADTRPVDRRVVHLNLEVDDVHEAYERLRREGVEFMHAPRVVNQGEQLEQWAATLRDPDGHAIALTHWEVHP